jgi:exopolysaccharide biosynthesis polyprenyl glycosylphosphotransferase
MVNKGVVAPRQGRAGSTRSVAPIRSGGRVPEAAAAAPELVGAPPTVVNGVQARVPAPGSQTRSMPVWLTKTYLVGADLAAIAVATSLAFMTRRVLPESPIERLADHHLELAVLMLPVWIAVFGYYRLYAARFLTTRLEEFRRLIHAVGASVVATAVMAFALRWEVSRGWLLLTFLLGVPVLGVERELVRRAFERLRRKGRLRRSVLIVGANTEGLAICEMLLGERSHGYDVVGFLDGVREVGTAVCRDVPVIGRIESTLEVANAAGVSSVIIATTAVDASRSNALVRRLTDSGIHVELSSSLADIAAGRLTVRPLGRFPVLYVEPVQRRGWKVRAKRAFDLVISTVALIVLLPVIVAVALAIKIDSRGPVLFKQERVGKDGRRFNVWKFRTMVVDAEEQLDALRHLNEAEGPLFKMSNDPRVTRVGRVLRALSLDELPQLANVQRGEMSLVGPRPALAREMEGWTSDLHERLRVKPGLTGMWQVSGRSDVSFEEYVRLDLYYVDNWSLWTDLAIVAKTIPTVLFRRGAY